MPIKKCRRSKETSSKSVIDRFSNLPDEVAHIILSFLKFKDRTRVGAVSKRCRQFHLSVPRVDFGSSYGKYKATKQYKVRLMSSFDRYLLYRGDNKIQRFSIVWELFATESVKKLSDDHFRVLTWIHNAVRCNVEELDIYLRCWKEYRFSLPPCVFLSESLCYLSVSFFGGILETPSLSISSNIRYLKLAGFTIMDEMFFKWISCCCKCIKELHLECIKLKGIRSVTIESLSLESFRAGLDVGILHFSISGEKLQNVDMSCRDYKTSVKIFAPSLRSLKWTGRVCNIQKPGKLMCLEKAEIVLEPKVNEFDKVFEFLCCLCRAKLLLINIDGETIKALTKEGCMAVPILDNVHKLRVDCASLDDDLVPAMVSLFGGMPNLNILLIKTGYYRLKPIPSSGFGMEYWKVQNLAFIHQLKEVILMASAGGSNEIKFAGYILEHAQNLKKLVILFPREADQPKVVEMVSRSKMVSTATVIIAQKSW